MKQERSLQKSCKQQAIRALMPQLAFALVVAFLHRLPLIAVGLGAQSYLPVVDTLESAQALFSADMQMVMTVCAVAVVLQWLLSAPLDLGLYRFLSQVMQGEKGRISSIFDAFGSGKDLVRSYAISIQIALRAMLWYGLPMVAFLGVCYLMPVSAGAFEVISILYFGATGLAFCKVRTYGAVYLLLEMHSDWTVRQALAQVDVVFRGKLKALVLFELGFLPLYLLGALSCGVLLLLVMIFEIVAFLLYFSKLYAPEQTETAPIAES